MGKISAMELQQTRNAAAEQNRNVINGESKLREDLERKARYILKADTDIKTLVGRLEKAEYENEKLKQGYEEIIKDMLNRHQQDLKVYKQQVQEDINRSREWNHDRRRLLRD